jgi:hypothetical protein
MSQFKVSYYVEGRRFVVTLPAASSAHAKQAVRQQMPGATLLIVSTDQSTS